MRPQLRLVSLQQLLEEQAQANNSLSVSINCGQPMAVADVKGAKGKVESFR